MRCCKSKSSDAPDLRSTGYLYTQRSSETNSELSLSLLIKRVNRFCSEVSILTRKTWIPTCVAAISFTAMIIRYILYHLFTLFTIHTTIHTFRHFIIIFLIMPLELDYSAYFEIFILESGYFMWKNILYSIRRSFLLFIEGHPSYNFFHEIIKFKKYLQK